MNEKSWNDAGNHLIEHQKEYANVILRNESADLTNVAILKERFDMNVLHEIRFSNPNNVNLIKIFEGVVRVQRCASERDIVTIGSGANGIGDQVVVQIIELHLRIRFGSRR